MAVEKGCRSAADRCKDWSRDGKQPKRRARPARPRRPGWRPTVRRQPTIREHGPVPTDQIRSCYGRVVSVRTKMVVNGIKDVDEAIKEYRGDSRLAEALKRMAQDDVAGGDQAAGFT